MKDFNLRRRIIINYLHHAKGYSVSESEELYDNNMMHFDVVFDLIGENTLVNVLKEIKNDKL